MANREKPIIPTGDIFSKRQKKLRGEISEVYVYNNLPNPLRYQIIYIWRDVFDSGSSTYEWKQKRENYRHIVNILRDEHGVPKIARPDITKPGIVDQTELENYILNEEDVEKAIDAVEVSFRYLERLKNSHRPNPLSFENAKNKLNYRFKEHGVGYHFTNGRIIRMDSELIHSEVVKPALVLLNQKHYAGAQEEFLKAHEHYRKGNAKEALSECLKAFESVMKAICDKRGWQYDNNATAKTLIQVCFDNGLVLPFWKSHYSSLRSLLESGVPTGRNNLGGHGQGTTPTTVPDHLVAYMLHMTASAIVFLAEADKNLR